MDGQTDREMERQKREEANIKDDVSYMRMKLEFYFSVVNINITYVEVTPIYLYVNDRASGANIISEGK